ncbi:pre-rRNA-processing protein ESF1 [Trypanosoma rangeli]|uniref:Pre-rRNA-processing protein ESF1 n=1 Tax=Trypanosoma rangeli TaxID=5698 RepID=A0A3S5IRC1_TRYRA|nr:pre-rRNA-processing protein ESF1 [Trypanosoma rangeli]RNF05801.1 pre-rRNA-processing protein ESF1 [Trypanosoma rangeli]|eukprot:RNF05801.1 pre-rRNA-processing protein ESF1 [Trypanosoma rangeli]
MKTLQSSSRGRGGRGGRGDRRFASRYTDTRFQIARHRRGAGRGSNPRDAALRDPRFARQLEEMGKVPAESDDDEEEEVGVVGEDRNEADARHEDSEQDNEYTTDESDAALSEGDEKELDDEVEAWSASDVEFIEPHRRLAIVNCSWDHIRAVDLYTILFYALPLGGQLIDVAVYMSDFGKRMLEHERVHGPDLWVKNEEREEDSEARQKNHHYRQNDSGIGEELVDAEDNHDNNDEEDPWEDDNVAMLHEEGEDGELFSQGKYRKYERDRMKYFYAVATFDSAETAETVYKQLDGMDIEASGVVLDLRYIDDDEVFENPVNKADSIPANYRPLAAFKAAALSQTRFRISWDQDDFFRYRSIRDSFTGDTAEDDIAAYIAPPDSSDEDDVGEVSGNKKSNARERLRIRKKYASLLEEIGGLPEEEQRGESEEAGAAGDEPSDDNSLNRFSDVELNDEEEGEENASDNAEFVGDMEATLDLDAGTKAARLQRDTQVKQRMNSVDLGSQAELKYKLRRKEMRKAKMEMLAQEREAEVAQRQEEREKKRQMLRETLGTDDAGAKHVSGREKRKTHAKLVKQRVAAEREAKKKMRASNSLGVSREVREAQRSEAATDAIDPRFQSKLLTDPRFHLDVAQKDKRTKSELVDLAATVATARRAKRHASQKDAKPDSAVEYFLNRPVKKAKRE